ncbi:hypothetical protein MMC07_007285 [Pseudocyphellaria aurata]|nr:hypothetical protein [Pseudocyphellaria aurata]
MGVRALNTKCWHADLNTSVSLNSSMMVDLAVASDWYLGQFHIDLGLVDGIDATYSSEIFNVTHSPSQAPLTWSGKAGFLANSALSSTTPASSLGSGAIAGISVGSSLVSSVLTNAAILLALRRRRRRRSHASHSGMLRPVQFPIKMTTSSSNGLAELAGQEEQWRELPGHTAAIELPATGGNLVQGVSVPGFR